MLNQVWTISDAADIDENVAHSSFATYPKMIAFRCIAIVLWASAQNGAGPIESVATRSQTDNELYRVQAEKAESKHVPLTARSLRDTLISEDCNQGQPCSNCKKRFPEPVCEYGSRYKRKNPSTSPPIFPISLPASAPRSFQVGNHARRMPPSSALARGRGRASGLVARWSGLDIETEYPVAEEAAEDGDENSSAWETLPGARVPPSRIAATGFNGAEWVPGFPTTTTNGRSLATLATHRYGNQSSNLLQLAGPLHCMGSLPIKLTEQNAGLIHTYSRLHYHFKGSFDGVPDPDNPFVKHLVPYCLQSPLLVNTSIYIAAQPLCERGFIDVPTTMMYKGTAIRLLNEYLRSDACTTDEVMGAVGAFIAIELYYGTATDMQAHLMGLRGMVQLRGGFPNSNAGSLSTKVALVADATIAISTEQPSILQKSPDFEFEFEEPPGSPPRPPQRVFNASFNSPLLTPRVPFSSCTTSLHLHPATAWILDEIAHLINTMLDLPSDPSGDEIEKVKSTAANTHERIAQFPEDSPETPRSAISDTPASTPGLDYESRVIDFEMRVVGFESETRQLEPLHEPQAPKPHSLLPPPPNLNSSSSSSSSSPSQSQSTPNSPSPTPSILAPSAASLYRAVRLAALLYARAIRSRRPFSEVCGPDDALTILSACWRIPLAEWRRVVGIFVFVCVAIVPTVCKSDSAQINVKVHTRFAKSIIQIGWMQISVVDWGLCKEMMERTLMMQRWLREGADKGPRVAGDDQDED